jgi:hypothetical protein
MQIVVALDYKEHRPALVLHREDAGSRRAQP